LTATLPPRDRAERGHPTVWGLTPKQIYDRFWAARGVQVVRQGERSAIVSGAELFLLTDPRSMVIFTLGEVVDVLIWMKPKVLFLRIRDVRDRGYREFAKTDEEGRFTGFERSYDSVDTRLTRVALTPDPVIARIWQKAEDPRTGWRSLRNKVFRPNRTTRRVNGRVFDFDVDQDVMECIRALVRGWKRPDSTVPRARRGGRDVWVDRDARVGPEAQIIGPVWAGAGRSITNGECFVGPSVLWDREDARPEPADLRWLEIEPKPDRDGNVPSKTFLARLPLWKRCFDIVFSLFVLILTLPLYPFVMLAILLEDGRPFFFSHRRETVGGKEFGCLKFRSMRKDADEIKARLQRDNLADGPQFFMDDDPRMTRVGRVIRDLQIDELPQFINVLLGQMSVVGPRPSPRKENQYCPPWREARLSVRPGITGLWQVMRTRARGLDFQEWIRFDLEYVENASFGLDLWILWRTFLMTVGIKKNS
jgi:lipopolysaccharide/colanic/teichoic acid biosynthesis glycosyltransferase